MVRSLLGHAAALLLGTVLLIGCSDDEPDPDGSAAGPGHDTMSIQDHCPSGVKDTADATIIELGGGDLTLVGAEFASESGNGTVMVLLHQTGMLGLCGWGVFAEQAAAAGLPSLAIDMCGYGGSECAAGEATPARDQVDLASAYAREEMGADRVVLVGASMGGSQTVIAVADGAEVDGWSDVSGPNVWAGTTLADRAADVRARELPGLVAHAADDDGTWYAAAQALAPAAGAEFLDGDSGHGYTLLTTNLGDLRPDGQALLDFVLSV